MDGKLAADFLRYSAEKLTQLSSRIQDCLDTLTYEQVWARGADSENAVGNLVLHLCGNVRQWIGHGVGGQADVRVRDREFAARGDVQTAELAERLEGTVRTALDVLAKVTPERLAEKVTIQAYHVTVLEAIYHVVEHFSQHTGQIIFATKQLTGQDPGYYRHLKGSAPHDETVP